MPPEPPAFSVLQRHPPVSQTSGAPYGFQGREGFLSSSCCYRGHKGSWCHLVLAVNNIVCVLGCLSSLLPSLPPFLKCAQSADSQIMCLITCSGDILLGKHILAPLLCTHGAVRSSVAEGKQRLDVLCKWPRRAPAGTGLFQQTLVAFLHCTHPLPPHFLSTHFFQNRQIVWLAGHPQAPYLYTLKIEVLFCTEGSFLPSPSLSPSPRGTKSRLALYPFSYIFLCPHIA